MFGWLRNRLFPPSYSQEERQHLLGREGRRATYKEREPERYAERIKEKIFACPHCGAPPKEFISTYGGGVVSCYECSRCGQEGITYFSYPYEAEFPFEFDGYEGKDNPKAVNQAVRDEYNAKRRIAEMGHVTPKRYGIRIQRIKGPALDWTPDLVWDWLLEGKYKGFKKPEGPHRGAHDELVLENVDKLEPTSFTTRKEAEEYMIKLQEVTLQKMEVQELTDE